MAVVQIKKIGSALARHTVQEEGKVISHLVSRCSLLLQRGSAALLLNRIRATQPLKMMECYSQALLFVPKAVKVFSSVPTLISSNVH